VKQKKFRTMALVNKKNRNDITSPKGILNSLKTLAGMLILCVFMIIPEIADAQNKEFTRAFFPDDSKGLRDARRNVRDGDRLFELGGGNIPMALEFYLKAYEFNPENARLNMRIGECYLNTPQVDRSVKYLERAVELNVPTLEIYYLLGLAYQQNYRFDEAIEQFTFYRQSLTPQEAIQQRAVIDRRIAECNHAKSLVKEPLRVFIDNMGSAVNSEFDDYSPVLSPDGSIIYFTSRRPLGRNPRTDRNDHKYFENIFMTRKVGDQWSTAEPIVGKINSRTHEATAGILPDGQTLYVYRGDKGGDLFESTFEKGRWGKPQKLPRALRSRGTQETSIVFTSDGNRVYFVSDRPGGFGGKDIWTAGRNERGRWSEPVNLGSTVNTEYDEESLYLAPDDATLYFSSQGHNSMGGFDVFRTVFRNGRWTRPENLGYPVNSPADDLFFVMGSDEKTAWFSTMRVDNYGGSDIYQITFLGPEKPLILPLANDLIAAAVRPPRINMMESEMEIITVPMTFLRGRILDDKTNEPVSAVIELYDNETEALLAEFNSVAETGEYVISLPGGKNYAIAVQAEDYLFHSENINISESDVNREIINDIRLKRVEVGQSIVLRNIFFDTGAAELRPESYAELGILYKLMVDNPSLKIEISGHTDNVGSAGLNQRLSERRARAVVDFLIERGIDRERLTFKGYGFDRPIASNETAEGRQMNRRTEFEIIEK
jgi:outer membrane protein OmpA-like peptidoglycan-associated protein/tetratricopeptide (TPR) repeat protein